MPTINQPKPNAPMTPRRLQDAKTPSPAVAAPAATSAQGARSSNVSIESLLIYVMGEASKSINQDLLSIKDQIDANNQNKAFIRQMQSLVSAMSPNIGNMSKKLDTIYGSDRAHGLVAVTVPENGQLQTLKMPAEGAQVGPDGLDHNWINGEIAKDPELKAYVDNANKLCELASNSQLLQNLPEGERLINQIQQFTWHGAGDNPAEAIKSIGEQLGNISASLSDLGQSQSVSLQMALSQKNQFETSLSNTLKSFDETSKGIIRNIG